jgi:hypothetical protein
MRDTRAVMAQCRGVLNAAPSPQRHLFPTSSSSSFPKTSIHTRDPPYLIVKTQHPSSRVFHSITVPPIPATSNIRIMRRIRTASTTPLPYPVPFLTHRMLEDDGERFVEERRKERLETLGIVYFAMERYIRCRCSDY